MQRILGISAYYHDAAAALLIDGHILAAAQEERFSRRGPHPKFPAEAAEFCTRLADIVPSDLDAVVFYDKPLLKFERLLETYRACAPRELRSFAAIRARAPHARAQEVLAAARDTGSGAARWARGDESAVRAGFTHLHALLAPPGSRFRADSP